MTMGDISRKKLGDRTERALIDAFKRAGWWVHLFAYNESGQPCDVIAFKGDDIQVMLVDVKHCSGKTFSAYRVEPNQASCFEHAMRCGRPRCGFAIWFDGEGKFYWLPYQYLIGGGKKTFKASELRELGEILCEW